MKLDDTLDDACKLLESMEDCSGNCDDFNKTKKRLEYLCELKDKRAGRSYDPDEWVTIGGHEYKKWTQSDITFLVFTLGILLPVALLLTTVHELGHALVAWEFGWAVIDFKVSFFPFLLDSLGGYVMVIVPPFTPDWQIAVLYAGGSIHSLAWAYVFFAIFYNFKLNRYLEVFFLMYSILLGFDVIIYIFTDVFFGGTGDWYRIYQISPIAVGIIFILAMANVVLFAANIKRIIRRADFE